MSLGFCTLEVCLCLRVVILCLPRSYFDSPSSHSSLWVTKSLLRELRSEGGAKALV